MFLLVECRVSAFCKDRLTTKLKVEKDQTQLKPIRNLKVLIEIRSKVYVPRNVIYLKRYLDNHIFHFLIFLTMIRNK